MLKDARKFKVFFTKGPVGQVIRWGLVVVLVMSAVILAGKMLLNDAVIKPNNYVAKEVETKVTKNPGKIVQEGFFDRMRGVKRQAEDDKKNELKGNNIETSSKTTLPNYVSNTSKVQPTATKTSNEKEEYVVTPLNLYTAKVDNNTKSMEKYAPYGRPIPCQLINTIDTANTETPIIGMVIKDVWHDGKLIIPAGAEVHGTAKNSPIRDKVLTGNSWVIVWRTRDADNGKELQVSGIALENGKVVKKYNKYELTDMSAGLKGYTIDTRDWATLKAIALKMTDGLTSLPATATGVIANLSGAPAVTGGTQDAANLYADMMMSKVLREGYFVRVPAGTKFYLYVKQTINMDKAKIGETLFSEQNKKSSIDYNAPMIMNPTYNPSKRRLK